MLQVPLDVHDALTNPAYQIRATTAVTYDSIVQDLQYAIKHLPMKGQASVGHATKGAAQSMLAKVNMYLNNWTQVKALTDAVIASGQYQLVPDYGTQFRQAGENSPRINF